MYKVHFKLFDEEGNYILDNISDRGFLVKRDSVKKEELPMLMRELCEIAEPNDSDKLLDTLRLCYQQLDLKSLTIKETNVS